MTADARWFGAFGKRCGGINSHEKTPVVADALVSNRCRRVGRRGAGAGATWGLNCVFRPMRAIGLGAGMMGLEMVENAGFTGPEPIFTEGGFVAIGGAVGILARFYGRASTEMAGPVTSADNGAKSATWISRGSKRCNNER